VEANPGSPKSRALQFALSEGDVFSRVLGGLSATHTELAAIVRPTPSYESRVIPSEPVRRFAGKSAMWITKAFSVAVDLSGIGTKATEGCLFARFRKK
jgi:hypothetical protein